MRATSIIAAALVGLGVPGSGIAGTRAWVSNTGTDSGTCPVTAPCRTFQYAHDHVDAGGEIDVKDSGGFGPIAINKAVTIVAPDGVLATIGVQAGVTGVSINAGAYDDVTLRGLTINGFKTSDSTGISAVSAGTLTVDSCNVFDTNLGVVYKASGRAAFTHNLFTGNYFAIRIKGGIDVLSSNVITDNTYGIDNESNGTYSYGSNLLANNSYNIIGAGINTTTLY